MDYDETIKSIAYSFLDDVDYQPRTEEEDDEFDFYSWWDEIEGYDRMHQIIDSYAAGSWRSHMEIILAASTDPDHIDSGLWFGADDWKQIIACMAFEVLRTDATEWISEHVQNNEPMFEPGGILPETNDIQIWLGKEAPLFIVEVKDPVDPFQSVNVTTANLNDCFKLDFWTGVLHLEGEVEQGEPRSLEELVKGGPPVVRPRRLYVTKSPRQEGHAPTVQVAFRLALRSGWITIPDYERHKALLPQLSVD